MRKRDKDQTGRKAKEDHEMAGVQGWVPSRAGPGGAAEGMRGDSTCFWDFLAFFIIRFIFISCFLIRFFFWEMRRSTSTPH